MLVKEYVNKKTNYNIEIRHIWLGSFWLIAPCICKVPSQNDPEKIKLGQAILRRTLNKCYRNRKWGLAARQSKANKECRLVERKVCFILDSGNRWWGGRTPVQRPTPPSADNQGARAFIDRRRGPHAETIVSSDRHLEIGHRWSDQHHLDCFRYS